MGKVVDHAEGKLKRQLTLRITMNLAKCKKRAHCPRKWKSDFFTVVQFYSTALSFQHPIYRIPGPRCLWLFTENIDHIVRYISELHNNVPLCRTWVKSAEYFP